jgi:hypothetical protein
MSGEQNARPVEDERTAALVRIRDFVARELAAGNTLGDVRQRVSGMSDLYYADSDGKSQFLALSEDDVEKTFLDGVTLAERQSAS